MWLLITCCIGFFISNSCLATIDKDSNNGIFPKEQCKLLGDQCLKDSDCCPDFDCSSDQDDNICIPSVINQRSKRNLDDFVIPPYYNPSNQLYPYGINRPGLPFYKAYESKQTSESKSMEWDHCRYHEDCGEGNCCYVHFRFRSLPKWFCRPNRDDDLGDLCKPLAKYRSLKDVPAWKQQEENREEQR